MHPIKSRVFFYSPIREYGEIKIEGEKAFQNLTFEKMNANIEQDLWMIYSVQAENSKL
jgi:hypothetical protein